MLKLNQLLVIKPEIVCWVCFRVCVGERVWSCPCVTASPVQEGHPDSPRSIHRAVSTVEERERAIKIVGLCQSKVA